MKAFIDLQTNSNNLKYATILAFSIVVSEDHSIIREHRFLVKPVTVLNTSEELVSGYANADLRNAPCFVDQLPEVIELLKDTEVFFYDKFSEMVWRKSLREIGFPLGKSPNIIQELLLKQNLISQRIDLDQILERFQISDAFQNPGHNALTVAKTYDILLESSYSFNAPKNDSHKESSVLELDKIPNKPGVYYFLDQAGTIIYVGKAVKLKERIKAHFTSKLPFEIELTDATFSIEFKETGNELISLLLESAEIDALKPLYNTQQIDALNSWTIESKIDSKGIYRLIPIEKNYSDNNHSISFNRDSVLVKLKNMALHYSLCYRYTGLERTSGSCSSPLCKGVCRKKEDKSIYNERTKKAYEALLDKQESYFLKLSGRNPNEEAFVLVKDGIYMGYGFIPQEYAVKSIEDFESFIEKQNNTYFTNRSIAQYMSKKGITKFDLA